MNSSIINLPLDITREITTFLIPASTSIIFKTVSSNSYVSSYSSRYEKAFIGHKILQNDKGMFLSIIIKKNNKFWCKKSNKKSWMVSGNNLWNV